MKIPRIEPMRQAIGRGDYVEAFRLAKEVEHYWDMNQCATDDMEEAALAMTFCEAVLADRNKRARIQAMNA
jgi:hypothetical protein